MAPSGIAAFITSGYHMSVRCVRHMTRNPDTLITTFVLPIMLLLLFVFVFGGAIQTNSTQGYINYVVPGILLLNIGYCASTTAVSVNSDMTKGIVGRLRSMPIPHSAFLTGHVVASVLRNLISTCIILLISLPMGLRPNAGPLDWVVIAMLLLLYALAITFMSAVFGLLAKSAEGAGTIGFVLLFLPYLSSAFVPVESMPAALRVFCLHQPVTVLLESIRGFMFSMSNAPVLGAVLWCAGITAVSIFFAVMLFRKKTTG